MRDLKGPHSYTSKPKKGKGYEPAEKDPIGSMAYQNLTQQVVNCLNQMPNQPIQKSLAIGYVKWQNKTIN